MNTPRNTEMKPAETPRDLTADALMKVAGGGLSLSFTKIEFRNVEVKKNP